MLPRELTRLLEAHRPLVLQIPLVAHDDDLRGLRDGLREVLDPVALMMRCVRTE